MRDSLLRAPDRRLGCIGHRGAKGHAPENTMASFSLAVDMGVDAIETDVHLSKDDQLVVIHDHTVDRTTDGRGYVRDMTVAELQRLDAGIWRDPRFAGERIPTLRELLTWAVDRVPVAIEIKNGPIFYPGIAEKTIRLLREFDMLDRAMLISFDHFVLREAKLIEPRIMTGMLYVGRLIDAAAVARLTGAVSINPNWAFVTRDTVESAHAAGLAVSTWCPNDLEAIRALDRMGVDSVGTDYPDLLHKI